MTEQELQKNLQEYTELAKKEVHDKFPKRTDENEAEYTKRISDILYWMIIGHEDKLRKMQRTNK